jgi:hypothetical protein
LITAPLKDKINILGSVFPEKIEFDGKKHRTDSYNEVLDIILKDTSQLYEKKKEEHGKKPACSQLVTRAGIELSLQYACFQYFMSSSIRRSRQSPSPIHFH